MKTKIYRRFFNPDKATDQAKVRQLVATFTSSMEVEAMECLSILNKRATDLFKDSYFSKFRYEKETEPEPIAAASTQDDIQIDLSKAIPTKRPITYHLGWHTEHGECHMIANNPRYGAIRGVVEDSAGGRRLFINRLATVWPNSEVK